MADLENKRENETKNEESTSKPTEKKRRIIQLSDLDDLPKKETSSPTEDMKWTPEKGFEDPKKPKAQSEAQEEERQKPAEEITLKKSVEEEPIKIKLPEKSDADKTPEVPETPEISGISKAAEISETNKIPKTNDMLNGSAYKIDDTPEEITPITPQNIDTLMKPETEPDTPEVDTKSAPLSSSKSSPRVKRGGKPWPLILLIVVMGGGLLAAILQNMFLSREIEDIKQKARSNVEIVKKIVAEKKEILKQSAPLKQETTELEEELKATQSIATDLAEENELIENELSGIKEKFSKLEGKMKGYASEVKKLVSGGIAYYDSYMEEKKEKEDVITASEKLKGKIKDLNGELDVIDKKYIMREADYIYDMAFIHAKADMFDEAIQSFKKVLSISGDDADIHYNLAILYDQVKKDQSSAIRHYKKYLELNPTADDLYEIRMRIESLKRSEIKDRTETVKSSKMDLNTLKY